MANHTVKKTSRRSGAAAAFPAPAAAALYAFADYLPMAVAVIGTQRTVLYLNRAFAALFALENREGWAERPAAALLAHTAAHWADADAAARWLLHGAPGKARFACAPGLREPAPRTLEIEIVAAEADGTRPACTLWLFSDVTAQVRAEHSLAMATAQFRRMAVSVPFNLFELDATGTIVAIEGQAFTGPGWTKADLVGQNFTRLVSALDDTARLSDMVKRLMRGDIVETVLEIEDRAMQIQLTPVSSREGGLERIFGVAVDVTERYRAERALRESQDRYRSIIENLEDGYYEVDIDGNLVVVNDALCRMVGFTREQLLAEETRRYVRFVSPDDVPRILRTFRQVLFTGQPVSDVEAHIIGSTGEVITVEMSVSLVRGALGGLPPRTHGSGFRGIVRDITARKEQEAALNRRMNLLGILQQVNHDLTQTLDMEIVLSVALNAALVLSDADIGFIGMVEGDYLRLVRSVGYNDVQRIEHEAESDVFRLYTGRGVIGRVLRIRAGEWVPDVAADADYVPDVKDTVAQIAVPIFSHDEVIGVLSVETFSRGRFSQEIFEFVNLLAARISAAIDNARLYDVAQAQVAELRDLNAQLSQLEQLKTDMIRITAHDLKNPLGIIMGYSEILRAELADVLAPAQHTYFDVIERALGRIARLSTDILSLERVQEAAARIRDIDLRALLASLADEHRSTLGEKGLHLTVSLPDHALWVRGDALYLNEAIENLLTNAIKYTPGGGRVSLCAGHDEACVWVEVEDTGHGIPEDLQGRLFQAFYRAKTEATRDIEGTGLGLYLVRRVVTEHGGQVRFRSTPGKGSMFGFELPLNGTGVLPIAASSPGADAP
jgi:PAS domain S-box-containing protein